MELLSLEASDVWFGVLQLTGVRSEGCFLDVGNEESLVAVELLERRSPFGGKLELFVVG